jgi:threonine/homoserine efflux transporter RhtA
VIDVLTVGLIVLGLFLAGLCLVAAVRDRSPATLHVGAAALVELVLLIQLVVAVVRLLLGDRPAELGTFVGYLIASVLVVPVAVLWAAAQRDRWSSVVLGVAGLVIVVLVLRMQQVWTGV